MTSKRSKQPRDQRAPKARPVLITERDLNLFELLVWCGYMASEQVERELFPSRDRCLRRCRQLYDANLLDVTLVQSQHDNLVSASRLARQVLREQRPGAIQGIRQPKPWRLGQVERRLMAVDAFLYIKALGEHRQTPLARWSWPGGSLHRELGLSDWGLSPDGVAELDMGEPVHIAIEVDLARPAPLENSLPRYQEVARQQVFDALWVVVSAGADRRLAVLDRLAKRAGLGEWMRALDRAWLTTRPLQELPDHSRDQGERTYGSHAFLSPLPKPSSC